jgi:hypothetical protein
LARKQRHEPPNYRLRLGQGARGVDGVIRALSLLLVRNLHRRVTAE